MKFYLDEDLSPRVAEILRRLGCEARSTQEAGNRGADDEWQLEYAARIRYVLVTRNRNDFIALTAQFFEEDRPHGGVLIVSHRISDPARLAKLLSLFAAEHPEGLPAYTIAFLKPY